MTVPNYSFHLKRIWNIRRKWRGHNALSVPRSFHCKDKRPHGPRERRVQILLSRMGFVPYSVLLGNLEHGTAFGVGFSY